MAHLGYSDLAALPFGRKKRYLSYAALLACISLDIYLNTNTLRYPRACEVESQVCVWVYGKS